MQLDADFPVADLSVSRPSQTKVNRSAKRPAQGNQHMSQDSDKVDFASLTLADAARLFAEVAGHSVTIAMLQADMSAGAPANTDGTINLVHYAAWLVREMARDD